VNVSGPDEDQQLVLDEDGFRDHGTDAARTGQPNDRRQQMQNKNGQVAHTAHPTKIAIFNGIRAGLAIRHAQVPREPHLIACSRTVLVYVWLRFGVL
jgi:hypothetical protein